MTAIARRRRRGTITAAVLAGLMSLAAVAMVVVGVFTLSNSQEGEAVGVDDRPRVTFPATPNAAVAVVDEDGVLTSLVVATLLPEGLGGSIVTVPVNADSTAGFGMQRRPIDVGFDAADLTTLVAPVEEMLSISIQRALIVGPDQLPALFGPIESIDVVLPTDVIDSSSIDGNGDTNTDSDPDSDSDPAVDGDSDGDSDADPLQGDVADAGVVATAGPQTLGPTEIVEVLTAVDDEGDAVEQHAIDVEVWSALARAAPVTDAPEAVAVDSAGRPIAPDSAEELIERLWQGEVGVRDLALVTLVASDNPTDADVVLVDHRDSTLVFAQISPGLVSTPTTGLTIRVIAPFSDEQLEQSDGLFDSTSELLLNFIGQMLFVQNSVVSADSAPTGADDVTLIEVTDERWLAETEQAAAALFGPSEVRVAETVLEGVDLQVTLGMPYLTREVARAQQDGTSDTVTPDDTVSGSAPGSSVPSETSVEPGTVGTDG